MSWLEGGKPPLNSLRLSMHGLSTGSEFPSCMSAVCCRAGTGMLLLICSIINKNKRICPIGNLYSFGQQPGVFRRGLGCFWILQVSQENNRGLQGSRMPGLHRLLCQMYTVPQSFSTSSAVLQSLCKPSPDVQMCHSPGHPDPNIVMLLCLSIRISRDCCELVH